MFSGEKEIVEYMRQQFGRNLTRAEALDLYERGRKIPAIR